MLWIWMQKRALQTWVSQFGYQREDSGTAKALTPLATARRNRAWPGFRLVQPGREPHSVR
jgi:hypothetical protein